MAAKFTCEQVARARLGEPATREGAELVWRCAFRDRHKNGDAHASLKINSKKDVFMCGPCDASGGPWKLAAFLAGCNPGDKSAVKVWLQAHGLLNGAKRKARAGRRGPAVAEFIHHDATGKPVYKKVRHEPGADGRGKDYLEWHFDGGQWKPGRGDAPIPVYGEDLLSLPGTIFITESHPDSVLLQDNGFIGITFGGACNNTDGYAPLVEGRDVVVLEDDDEAGKTFAQKVCASVHAKAKSVKLISFAAAHDFSEWMQNGGSAEKLQEMVERAAEWRPADGAEILDSVMHFIRRFVSLTEAQARVVTVWVAHTHVIEAADCTPYLNPNSAEKQSGKTRLLEVCEPLVSNPWLTGRVTAAVLVRKIDGEKPTLLLDESDAAFQGEKEYAEALRGVLNTGYRRGGCASICVGQGANISYKDFSTFSAKAIAGIGSLPDTVADRSIPLRLKRARRGTVERWREREGKREAAPIAAKLAAWAQANLEKLREARPEIPAALSDRQADVCEPLLAIADLAGGDWPEAARRALVELCVGAQAADDSIGVKLLGDIKAVFCPKDDDGKPLPEVGRVASEDLAESLGKMEGRPWPEWKAGKPITKNQLAKLLSKYDIGPKTVRLPDGRRLKGYEREQFEEAWALYLPPDSPLSPSIPDSKRDTVTSQYSCGSEPLFQSVTPDSCHASENAVSASKNAGCHGVTVEKLGNGKGKPEKADVEWEV